MKAPKETEVRIRGSSDPFWWGVAGLLSLGADRVPGLLSLDGSDLSHMLVLGCALFLTGALVGAIRRNRPWRWGVACFAAFGLRDLVVLLSTKGLTRVDAPGIAAFLIGHMGIYFLYALPVALGGFLGALIMSAGLE
ncbi:MAG TPA: hypothetical protein VN893_06445 [Bryobacteraceae bacterium]|nr:hypothetical protein [Bryobacteraceae bacterium]